MFVMLFTGISGSGKSTLANAVAEELKKKEIPVDIIDGDDSRQLIGNIMGHSREERIKMGSINRAIGHYLVRNEINVIYALVCPYEEIRKQFREAFGDHYIEIYVKTDGEVCAKRDVKGLYELSRQGMLDNFNGINAEFEIPLKSDITIDTAVLSVDEAKVRIIEYLRENNFVS